MNLRIPTILSVGTAVLALAAPAHAAIINTTGDLATISAPPNVREGKMESNTLAGVFTEQVGTTLAAPVAVDINAPGAYAAATDLTDATIAAGTVVDSFYLYSDPASGIQSYRGSVTFDQDVLGIIVRNTTVRPRLGASDLTLGAPGTLYPSLDGVRDLEFATDSLALTANRRTVAFNFRTSTDVDSIRIVTASAPAVPEPSTFALLGAGLLPLLRRRSA